MTVAHKLERHLLTRRKPDQPTSSTLKLVGERGQPREQQLGRDQLGVGPLLSAPAHVAAARQDSREQVVGCGELLVADQLRIDPVAASDQRSVGDPFAAQMPQPRLQPIELRDEPRLALGLGDRVVHIGPECDDVLLQRARRRLRLGLDRVSQ